MALRQKPIKDFHPEHEATATGGKGLDEVLDVFDSEKEVEEKRKLVSDEIQKLELVRSTIDKSAGALEKAQPTMQETLKAFHAAKESADNVVSGICAAIVRVENEHFKAELDDESVKQLLETNSKILEHERGILAEHLKQEHELWERHADRMRDILRRNKGIWMSEKVFYIVGSIGFLCTFIVLMYIVLWVYYHWIA